MITLSVLLQSSLPFLGQVAAGFNGGGWESPAEEELGDTITFEDWLLPNKEANCLVSVSTDAMKNAGILPGDILIMERRRAPADGDIIIAEVDGETIMRRYQNKNGYTVLMPANPAYKPIKPRESVTVLGVITSVIRKYK